VLIEANTFKKDALKQCKIERERERVVGKRVLRV